MTKRTRWHLIAAIVLALGVACLVPLLMAMPWVLFPLRDVERLRYPDGVEFTKSPADYTKVAWDASDWDHPGVCPLVVHFAGAELDAASLGSVERLRREGWTERVYESNPGTVTGTSMHSPGGVIRCSYRRGLLTNVTVDATKAVAAGDVAISLGGQRVELPATADTITAALGPPLAKD